MKGDEDICTIIPGFYMHAIMKCKKKTPKKQTKKPTTDVSHNIQLKGPYKCPAG